MMYDMTIMQSSIKFNAPLYKFYIYTGLNPKKKEQKKKHFDVLCFVKVSVQVSAL